MRRIWELPQELKLFLKISAVLWGICLACELFCRFLLHAPSGMTRGNFPYTWPVLWFNHWRDFWCWIPRFSHLHTLRFFSPKASLDQPFTYPPAMALLFEGFYVCPHPIRCFLIVTTAAIGIFAWGFYLAMRRTGLAWAPAAAFLLMACLMSYPFWFEFDLANMEIWVWIFVASGVWAFLRDKPYLAAVLFAVAGSAKLFPFVFFALFLTRRKYGPILLGGAVAAVLSVGGLWMMYPNLRIAINGVKAGMGFFRSDYLLRMRYETGFDHSIFGFMKRVAAEGFGATIPDLTRMNSIYLPVIACIGVFLYFRYIRRLPINNQVLALTIASILFCPTSHDYTLMHLYVPWALLVLLAIRARGTASIPGLKVAFICMAIAMSAETEIIRRGIPLGGQIKCLALVVLFVIALRFPFSEETPAKTERVVLMA